MEYIASIDKAWAIDLKIEGVTRCARGLQKINAEKHKDNAETLRARRIAET